METKTLERVIYEKDGAIARIIMNYPETANVQDSKMVWDVETALGWAEHDLDIKVVILKGNGRGFCAGHGGRGENGDWYPEFMNAMDRLGNVWYGQYELFVWPVLHLWEFPKPVIAQVHGYAIGGGTYFAFLPDITIASEETIFQMPLVHGLALPGGESMVEPYVFMNFKRAAEYLYTAQTLSAAQALDMGLLNKVVSRDELEDTVEEMAHIIAQAPLATLVGTKQLIKRSWEMMGFRQLMQMSNDMLTAVGANMKGMQETFAKEGKNPREKAEFARQAGIKAAAEAKEARNKATLP